MKDRNKVFSVIVTVSVLIIVITAVIGYNQISTRKNDYIIYLQAKEDAKNGNIEESISILDDIEKKYGESDVLKIDKANIYLNAGDGQKAQIELSNAFELNPTLYNNINLMLAYAQTAYENKDNDTAIKLLEKSDELVKEKEDEAKKNKTKVSDEIKEIKNRIEEMMLKVEGE